MYQKHIIRCTSGSSNSPELFEYLTLRYQEERQYEN